MRIAFFLVFVLLLFSVLSFFVSGASVSNDGEYIQFQQVTMSFHDVDAHISINYDLNAFSSIYIFLFGTHNLEPTFEVFFSDFEETDIREIGKQNAVVFAKNVSRQNDGYYLHDSLELSGNVRALTMIYPDGSTRSVFNVKATPDTFYSGSV